MTHERGLVDRVAARLLATAFGLLAVGAAVALAGSVPVMVLRALHGLSPSSALACALLGACLAWSGSPRIGRLLAGAALAAAAGSLLAPSSVSASLGAPSPLIAAGLIVAALSLFGGASRRRLTMRTALAGVVPLLGLTLIGLFGTASSALGQHPTGAWMPSLAINPAASIVLLALAIWTLRQRALDWLPALRSDDRIALLTFCVLTMLVMVTGLATFWAVQTRLQESEQERLVQSAYRREMAFNQQLDGASRFALDLARRPSVARALQAWPRNRQAAEATLREEIDAVWRDGLTGLHFESTDPSAVLPSRGMLLTPTLPSVPIELVDDMTFDLQWHEGLLARTRVPVLHAGAAVGWIVSQQRLTLMTAQLFETADLGPDVEVKLCHPASRSSAVCLPGGPSAASTTIALQQADGTPTAIARGIRGDQGSMLTTDATGAGVIDVFASVRRPIGLRLRQSVDSVMAPVREKLRQVMAVVLVLLAAGVTVLSLQVRPLASRLVRSEREAREAQALAAANEEHLRTVMDNVADGIVTTGADGRVTYLNQAAALMTGWQAAEAIGQPFPVVYAAVEAGRDEPASDIVATALAGACAARPSEIDLLPRNGTLRHGVTDRVSLVRAPTGHLIGTVLVFHDVTADREREAAISHEANHDALTGLANRKAFERRLAQLAHEVAERPARLHSLVYIDLDKFKQVNDTAGHEAGDHLLKQVTALMHQGLRASDLFARVGGDEFAVLLSGCASQDAARIAEALRASVAAFEFVWKGQAFQVGTSIGIATFEAGCGDPAAIVRSADAACYRAKHAGRGNVQMHDAVLGAAPVEA